MTITDPTTYLPMLGNFSVLFVNETVWNGFSTTTSAINFSTSSAYFNQTANLTFIPNPAWVSAYHSMVVTVKNFADSATRTGWYSFEAKPFTASFATVRYNFGTYENVTATVNLTDPITFSSAQGNLTTLFENSWPTRTTYNFTIGSCFSWNASGGCYINGNDTVHVIIPSSGWEERYYYIYPELTTVLSSTRFTPSTALSFNIVAPLQAYTNTGLMALSSSNSSVSNGSFYYQSSFNATDNVTLFLYGIRNVSDANFNVTVNSVEYSPGSNSCWSESCRSYSILPTWSRVWTNTSGSLIAPFSSAYLRLQIPSGGWPAGSVYLRVNVSTATLNASIKGANFYVSG
jgi:hypothetical protein